MSETMQSVITRREAISAGLVKYFTGKPCKHGHVSDRYVASKHCVECNLIRSQRYAAQNPQLVKDRARASKLAPIGGSFRSLPRKDRSPELQKAFLDDYRNRELDRLKEHYWKNRDVLQKYKRDNLARARATSREWFKKNPGKNAEYCNKRRALRISAEGSFDASDVLRMLEAQASMCNSCGVDVSNGYHVDHIVPLSRGGTNWPSNLQILCPSCNCSKNDLLPEEWEARKYA